MGLNLRTLQTPRLALVPQVQAHAQAMFEVLIDPALYLHENAPPPYPEWLRQRFARLESRRSPDGGECWLNWVLQQPDGRLIGYVQATVLPDHSALLAYVLGSVHWGQGLASEAVRAMMDELVATYGVTRFEAMLKQSNTRSMRLLERLGFALVQDVPADTIEADEYLMRKDAAA